MVLGNDARSVGGSAGGRSCALPAWCLARERTGRGPGPRQGVARNSIGGDDDCAGIAQAPDHLGIPDGCVAVGVGTPGRHLRSLEIVANWPPGGTIGPLLIPPALASKHGHTAGDPPSDALLEDLARHYSLTVYHPTSTCRMGTVVDERLRVVGVDNLRIADASIMPNIVSGNTNAACIMIGEKAAELLATDHGTQLRHPISNVPA
jgi:hypothetical protein